MYAVGVCTGYLLERIAGLPTEHFVGDVVIWIGFGAFAVVGSLLVTKRPTNVVGWIMATVALMVAILPIGGTYAAYVISTRGRPNVLAVIGAWTQTWYWYVLLSLAIIYLPLLFPDGRLLSRRWLPIAVLPGIGTLGITILGALVDTLPVEGVRYRIDNPIGVEGLGYVEGLPYFGLLTAYLSWALSGR